jgi:hypothetical protein
MRFIRTHITIILVIIMSILCTFAIGVAINITIIMIQRRDQVVKVIPAGQSELNENKSNSININKLKDQTIILNGIKFDGLEAYLNGKDDYLIPTDVILDTLKIKYNYYDSDNILEWDYKGKKVSIKLGEDGLWIGKNKLSIGTPVIAGKNHILASIDLFTYFDGYTIDKTAGNNTVFVNYYPEYEKKLSNIKALSQINGKTMISDIFNKTIIWGQQTGDSYIDSVEPSYDGLKYLLKSGQKVYLLTAKKPTKPIKLAINPLAHWSADSKYLYWIDSGNKMSYLYDIENDYIQKIGDYYLKINPENDLNLINNAEILLEYKKSGRFERISFTNSAMDGNYTFIKRNGKIVIEGNLLYSPDKKKVVYYVKDEGYYFAYSEGTKKTFLGNINDIRWINNNKFFMSMGGKNYIVTNNGKTVTLTDDDWILLGQTQQGELYFSKNNVLYCEINGEEKEIRKLPWTCDAVFSRSVKGPFIAVSNKENGIYFVDKENITRIGTDKLAGQTLDTLIDDNHKDLNFTYSQDGRNIAFYQEENNFLSLSILNTKDYELKKIMLDFTLDSRTGFDEISMKWITNSLLLVYSDSKWCAIDIKDSIKLYRQSETMYRQLFGVFAK